MTAAKNAIVKAAFENFRVRMFVKSAVKLVEKLQLKLPLKKAHNYLYSVSVMYVYT